MRASRTILMTAVTAVSLFVAACGGTATSAGGLTPSPSSVAVSAGSTSAATDATTSASPWATARYDVVPNGTNANYRVREQLVRLSAPSDAVGATSKVTGDIVIGADGKVDASQSKLVVDLTSLQSDSGMRDRFIQGNTLDTAEYPTATFVPTSIQGPSMPLPSSGQQSFKLLGNLTVHGVTKPVTFNVTTQVNGSDVTGQATTDFTFEDFGMSSPKAGEVLSVKDDVKLEVTLHLTRSA